MPFHFTDALDHIVGATVGSFPTGSACPAAAGGTAAGAKVIVIQARSVIAAGIRVLETTRGLGVSRLAQINSQDPLVHVRVWATTWWRNREILAIHTAADMTITVSSEVLWRQFYFDGRISFTMWMKRVTATSMIGRSSRSGQNSSWMVWRSPSP